MKINTDIIQAAHLLKKDEIVAIPTETVYGLAGNIYSEKAILKIFELKKRPLYNPLIVHIQSVEDLDQVALEVPEKAKLLAEKFWPGPLTMVLKKQKHISDLITAGKDTVAVRVPNHALTLALLRELEFPVAAPSANPFGSISPTTAQHVATYFGSSLDFVLDGGACAKGIESTIIGFEGTQPILYRAGSTTVEAIEAVVGPLKIFTKDDVAPIAPGMLTKHYAPTTQTVVTDSIEKTIQEYSHQKIGVLAFSKAYDHPSIQYQVVLSDTQNLEEAASKLYACLHDLDAQPLDIILVENVPNEGLGIAINDKLARASAKN